MPKGILLPLTGGPPGARFVLWAFSLDSFPSVCLSVCHGLCVQVRTGVHGVFV
jgi:hypothetical protein